MKKLLLSLLAVAGISLAATAAEVSFDFVGDGTSDLYGMTRLSGTTSEYNANPTIVTEGAVSIKLTGNTRLWKDGLRFYKSSAMEITAPGYTITDVTFGKITHHLIMIMQRLRMLFGAEMQKVLLSHVIFLPRMQQ